MKPIEDKPAAWETSLDRESLQNINFSRINLFPQVDFTIIEWDNKQ
jgi:hypothetical protein